MGILAVSDGDSLGGGVWNGDDIPGQQGPDHTARKETVWCLMSSCDSGGIGKWYYYEDVFHPGRYLKCGSWSLPLVDAGIYLLH